MQLTERKEMAGQGSATISGFVKPGFEVVREAFSENWTQRQELGAACCIYYQGERVVDLWGGVRNRATGEPWEEDTMVLVFSSTKGMSGLAMALAHSRGWLDYEERVCSYWPGFAQQGKERITVRQLLSHQAGLYGLDVEMDRDLAVDLDRLAAVLARQRPAHEPGTRQAYHAVTLGFYEGELLRRVDPQHRSLGQFFREEIASPLGLDFYIGLPDTIPDSRLATIEQTRPSLAGFNIHLLPMVWAVLNPRSPLRRSLLGSARPTALFDRERVYVRDVEVPAANGVGTARAIARAYSVFATGGRELGVRQETLDALMAPAVPPRDGFRDECLLLSWEPSLGFQKPDALMPFGHPVAFGAPGWGGSFGFADPKVGLGYAYVMNRMGASQGSEPREEALRQALYRVIGKPRI
jgi:CubicO group peptidase (beta-lactamase class C family)